MKRLLFILVFLCSSQLWASCVASTSGAWTTGGNWTGCAGVGGVPASTDAVTVGNTFSMTCNGACVAKTLTTAGTGSVTVQSGGTLTVSNGVTGGSVVLAGTGKIEIQSGATATLGGQAATSNTVEVTVGGGTTLQLDNGSTFNMYGSVKVSNTGTGIFNGHTICTPPSTSVYYSIYSSGVVASDTTLISFVGTDYYASPAVFEGPAGQTAGDSCRVTNGGGNNPKFVAQNAIFNNLGDTSGDAVTMTLQTIAESILVNHLLMLHSGKLNLSTNSGVSNSTTFDINGLDLRNPNAQGKVVMVLSSLNATAQSGTRNIKNLTCSQEAASASAVWQMQIQGQGFKFGSSVRAGDTTDTTGIAALNCQPNPGGTANAINQSMSNSFLSLDSATPDLFIFSGDYNQNDNFQDSIFYYHIVNPQGIGGTANRSAAINNYSYNFIDGDGYETGDAGTFCETLPTGNCNYDIMVGMNLNPADTGVSTASISLEHLTSLNQASSWFGESSGSVNSFLSVQYNLMSYPAVIYQAGLCTIYNAGFAMQNYGYSQTGMTLDHNGYWGMQNSGDPGAGTCIIPNASGNGLLVYGSYLTLPQAIRGTQNAKTATSGTSGTTLVCSGCSFSQAGELAVIPGDFIYKTYGTSTWSTVASVTNGTTLVMNDTNAGISSGNTFTIYKSYINNSGVGPLYGSAGFGANDIHAPITYMNPNAAVCDYYNWIGGSLTCTHTGTSTDTNISTIAHAMVAINGYDYGSAGSLAGTNCAANCPAVVTPMPNLNPAKALAWLRTQYTQYNGVYKNLDRRGSPYQDMGATLTYPAAVIQ
jgi:hypothetical protein